MNRIIGQVITGIGFLEASTFLKKDLMYVIYTQQYGVAELLVACRLKTEYYIEVLIGTLIIILVKLLLKPLN